jgi:hypothetical protein
MKFHQQKITNTCIKLNVEVCLFIIIDILIEAKINNRKGVSLRK